MKTLVEATHKSGQWCSSRGANGQCNGVETALWLNSLPDDDVAVVGGVSAGEIRRNWLSGEAHVKKVRGD